MLLSFLFSYLCVFVASREEGEKSVDDQLLEFALRTSVRRSLRMSLLLTHCQC